MLVSVDELGVVVGAAAVGVGMGEVVHELESGEQRLVVLMLVLDDHAVHEAAGEQRIAAVECGFVEHAERALAHVGDERARARRVEDRQRHAVAARVLERVVDVVERGISGCRAAQRAHQPQFLVVTDVREVPAQRRHELRHLAHLVGWCDRIEQPERAPARVVERVDDLGLRRARCHSYLKVSRPRVCSSRGARRRPDTGHEPRSDREKRPWRRSWRHRCRAAGGPPAPR